MVISLTQGLTIIGLLIAIISIVLKIWISSDNQRRNLYRRLDTDRENLNNRLLKENQDMLAAIASMETKLEARFVQRETYLLQIEAIKNALDEIKANVLLLLSKGMERQQGIS